MPNTQTAPALQDDQWYWVRYDTGFGADAIEAPARYRAHVDCFYSHQFSGIPSRECEVLGPALRSPPADLTFDALLKRIKASPFRDDMALASLLVSQAEEIKALRNAVLEEREAILSKQTKAHAVDGHCAIVLVADIRARSTP